MQCFVQLNTLCLNASPNECMYMHLISGWSSSNVNITALKWFQVNVKQSPFDYFIFMFTILILPYSHIFPVQSGFSFRPRYYFIFHTLFRWHKFFYKLDFPSFFMRVNGLVQMGSTMQWAHLFYTIHSTDLFWKRLYFTYSSDCFEVNV